MCLLDNNTKRKNFQQLNYVKRIKIEQMLKDGKAKQEIADELGYDITTIRREIKKGQFEKLNSDYTTTIVYAADVAQRKADENKGYTGPSLKITNDYELAEYIEEKIKKEKYSPEAVAYELEHNKELSFETRVCCKTIYNYIYAGIFEKVTDEDLVVGRQKKKKEQKQGKLPKRGKGKSIEERPEIVDKKEELGHYEIDTVIGQREGKNAVLLTFTERVTNLEYIEKIDGKTSDDLIKGLEKIKKRLAIEVKSITADNGSENMDYEGIKKVFKKEIEVYYAHPYCSWERGLNENTNRMIRRFLPKGCDMNKVSKKMVKKIENWINNYPRKKYGGKSSNMFYNSMETEKLSFA